MTGYLWRGKPDLEQQNATILKRREGKVRTIVDQFKWGGYPCGGSPKNRRELVKRPADRDAQ